MRTAAMRTPSPLQKFCAFISLLLPGTVLLLTLVNTQVKGSTGGLAVTPRFHVGVFDGSIWFHSHELPYREGALWLPSELSRATRKSGLDLPGVYYRCLRFPRDPEALWTLRLSLAYPLAVSAVCGLMWLGLARRASKKKPAAAAGQID